MRHLFAVLMGFTFFCLMGINGGTQIMPGDIQQRAEIEKSTADLQYLSAKLNTDQKDLADAQASLEGSKGKVINYQDLKEIQDRIQKATFEIHEDNLGISKDVTLLRLHWNVLTEDEKKLVLEVEKTQM